MTAMERAHTYAAIFLNVGDRWRDYVPVDATVKGDVVHLDGVTMEWIEGGWRLAEIGPPTVVIRSAVSA